MMLIAANALAGGFPQSAEPAAAAWFDRLAFQPSMLAGASDSNGQLMAGTEIMNLVPFQGRLYTATSLWMESDRNAPKACQVLVLDSPNGKWKVDYQFARNHLRLVCLKPVTFTTDDKGNAIPPVSILLAAPDVTSNGTVQVFSRDDETSKWAPTVLGPAARYSTTRALGFHHDKVTGVDLIFAGNDTLGNLRGVYDPQATGRIRWEKTPEFSVPPDERVMGFCDCNGVCYCATTRTILKRADGPAASWQQVYNCPQETKPVGIRGLTSIDNPSGDGESLLFAALSKVRRLDAKQGFKETVELDMPAFLSAQRGIKVSFALAAYNEFLPCKIPGAGETVWLFGFESTYPPAAVLRARPAPELRLLTKDDPPRYYDARAFFFIRRVKDGKPGYTTTEVTDPRQPTLVAVRAIAVSPFAEDQGRAFYFGGFDCNSIPSHNTAWIYRAEPGPTP